jgi:hypothetical protein
MGGIFLDGNGGVGWGHTQSVKYFKRKKRKKKLVIKNHKNQVNMLCKVDS